MKKSLFAFSIIIIAAILFTQCTALENHDCTLTIKNKSAFTMTNVTFTNNDGSGSKTFATLVPGAETSSFVVTINDPWEPDFTAKATVDGTTYTEEVSFIFKMTHKDGSRVYGEEAYDRNQTVNFNYSDHFKLYIGVQ